WSLSRDTLVTTGIIISGPLPLSVEARVEDWSTSILFKLFSDELEEALDCSTDIYRKK
ncbi:15080_t:CDS:1, partial [Funneliformis caledonium]